MSKFYFQYVLFKYNVNYDGECDILIVYTLDNDVQSLYIMFDLECLLTLDTLLSEQN